MPLATNFSYDVPGVYVSEATFGAIPPTLASFNTVYMAGYSNKAGAPTDPTFVQSVDDFVNIFGTSNSLPSVKLFFNQRSGAGLWFINVPTKATYSVTVPTATTGTTYTLTIDTLAVSYVATATDTVSTIVSGLAAQVNKVASHSAYMIGSTIRVSTSSTVTATANITLGTKAAAPSYPIVGDVIEIINKAFDSDMRQGFLIAPEFFQSFTTLSDRTALAGAMEAFCSDPNFNWLALADCGSATASQATGAGAVNLAISERNALSSAKGHLAFFFPYWVDVDNNQVPMSAAVAGVALRRFRQQGYRQPAAGTQFPVYGVTATTYNITDKIQSQLNPIGVNCGRKLPAGRGTVIYGARTVSTNTYYRFMTTRVILNVLEGSLARSFDEVVFTTVDGQGELFGRIKGTSVGICEDLRKAGALYGATSEDAYLVICDATNNSSTSLEAGVVAVDVIVKPSPLMEVLSIRVSRASLGTKLTEIAQSGDTSDIKDTGKTESVGSVAQPKNP